MEKTIHIPNVLSVQDFVDRAALLPVRIELICGEEHINAKSMMNVLCADLSIPMKLRIYAPDKEAEAYFDSFEAYLQ